MHSHVLNFKADFDILGQSNSVQLMSVVPTTKTYPCEFPFFFLFPGLGSAEYIRGVYRS